jgi:hypothetical protein
MFNPETILQLIRELLITGTFHFIVLVYIIKLMILRVFKSGKIV